MVLLIINAESEKMFLEEITGNRLSYSFKIKPLQNEFVGLNAGKNNTKSL